MAEAKLAGPGRLHALDAVRGGALILGVAFHAALSFLPGGQIWIVADPSRSTELSILFFSLHIFRMTVFFLIAGFFAHMMLERRGVGGFIKNRLMRIGVPLISFWPLVMTGIIAVLIWVAIRANGGVPPANAEPPPPFTVATFPLTHLWFLYVLLIFYAVTLVLHVAINVLDRDGVFRTRVVDPIVRVLGGSLAPMWLGAPLVAALWFTPNWLMWFGIPTPDTGLIPNTTALVAYGTAFGFGWLVARQPEMLQSWTKDVWSSLGLGGCATTICLAIVGATPVITPAEHNIVTFVYACCYALAVWGWTIGLIGLAMLALSKENRAIRYLADASYWIYIMHLPLVLALQAWIAPLDWPWFAKYPAILAAAFAMMLVSYQLFVRYTFIGAILNGKRVSPRKQRRLEAAAAAAAAE